MNRKIVILCMMGGIILSACQSDSQIKNKKPAQQILADNSIGSELLVMSFNIRNGRAEDGENRWEKRRDILFDVFRNHKPDVVGFQEAVSFQIDYILVLPDTEVIEAEILHDNRDGKYPSDHFPITARICLHSNEH